MAIVAECEVANVMVCELKWKSIYKNVWNKYNSVYMISTT